MSIVIGLHGAKGSGKDHFFKVARDAFPNLNIQKIAYADPIKNEVCRIFDLADEDQYDAFKRTHLTYHLPGDTNRVVMGRQVVREIGMMMRGYHQQQFVEYVENTINAHPEVDIWCITDMRFENELQSVKTTRNSAVVKILRSGVEFDGHATEIEIPDNQCDYILHNGSANIENYDRLIVSTVEKLISTFDNTEVI